MAGSANEDHAQELNALEQRITEMTGQNARLQAEVQTWTQRTTDATREMGAAKTECMTLSRNIANLTIQVQQSTDSAVVNQEALEAAEKLFETRRRGIESELATNDKNLRAILKKAIDEAGRRKIALSCADQRREQAESEAVELGRRLQLVNEELDLQKKQTVSPGNDQGELLQLAKTCQAKTSKIQSMEVEVANLKKILIEAETDSLRKDELERTIRSLTTSSQEQDKQIKRCGEEEPSP